MNLTIRNRAGLHHCAEATAAGVVAASLRAGRPVAVRDPDSPTWWAITRNGDNAIATALNPSLFNNAPPTWANRLAAAAARLI
ncbi:MAG: hypothetical protein ACK5OX_09795 [Desertimonas sp.]